MSSMSSDSDAVKPKPKRVVNWLWRMPASGIGVIHITIGKDEHFYFVRPIESDFGEVYEVCKLVEAEGLTATYHVNLEQGNESCDCPGGTYHHHCKHRDALMAMRAAGRL